MRHKWRNRIGYSLIFLTILSIPIVAFLNYLMGDTIIVCGPPLSRGCESLNYMGGFLFIVALMMVAVFIKESKKEKKNEGKDTS